ncbi:LysR family transcriptional regulator [Lacticaseibacillus sharpeae]|uniref:Transcription regulator n=1 Tax=Lacticaseibacillus sharpeae JCM 1186 = DSM 20505 TaxID=1291052 RepID=A0A0R1ZHZ6_9LACO|nr:LysR family transcriptional regulator [Lacticaseibacillus sharpeae]KRM54477.1 transcription regulator [Lacticaseibacillus sharpeae JCM 1186 = DSM 20505]
MELRVLRYFLMVVNERNISRAAEKLHVSQPTISRQLKDLEDELGVTLFVRGSRSIDLTEAGEYFATQARQIVVLADKAVANVNQTQELTGSIMIGSAEAPMMTTVAQAIARLAVSAPQVHVGIYSTDANEVHSRLNAGVFDFGVVMEPIAKDDMDFINLPGTTAWGLLVRQDSPLAQKHAISADDLVDQRIVMPQQHGSIDYLANWLGASDRELNVVATYNLLYNASIMVDAGVGATLCLDGIINTASSDLRFIPLAPRLEAKSSLIWPKHTPLSPAATAFLRALRSLLPSNH